MEQIISLGSNCSVTYQLNKYNLRQQSFPFDWSKITIKQLNKVLESKFKDYENVFKNYEKGFYAKGGLLGGFNYSIGGL